MNKSKDKKPTITVKVSGAHGSGKTQLIERVETALKQHGYSLQKSSGLNQTAIWTSDFNTIKLIENR